MLILLKLNFNYSQIKAFLLILFLYCSGLILNATFAIDFMPEQPNINSKAFLLLDFNSGQLLLEKNSDLRLEPASLTKIMTMYVIDHEIKIGRLSLNEEVTISKKAWQTTGSRMFLNVNSKVKVEDLIKGIIIQSGNDASVAMAEHIAGSEKAFADLMNSYAAALGMQNSHFVNATGLSEPNHYSTAKDLAILSKASIKEHPKSYVFYSQKSFMYNNIEQLNRNKLLWRNNFVDGIKTGQTDNAGYCLAVSGINDQTRLIAVLLGAKSDEIRTTDASKLLNWGFRFFTSHKIYSSNTVLDSIRIWGGDRKKINIGLLEDVYISLPKHDINKLTTSLNIPNIIKAPLLQGTSIGKYIVKLKDEIIAEYPVIALSTVGNGHFFSRVSDQVSIYFNVITKNYNSSTKS